MSELHVVATIPARPDTSDAIRLALETLVAATRAEEGCISDDLFQAAAALHTFVTVERWVDQAAMDLHIQTPHIAAAIGAADGHWPARPRSTRWCGSTSPDATGRGAPRCSATCRNRTGGATGRR